MTDWPAELAALDAEHDRAIEAECVPIDEELAQPLMATLGLSREVPATSHRRPSCELRSRVAATPWCEGSAGEAFRADDPAVADPADAPFLIGESVIDPGRLHLGPATVVSMEMSAQGHWIAGISWPQGAFTLCPAHMLRRAPPGFCAAPQPPVGSVRAGLSEQADRDARARDEADPEHRLRWDRWPVDYAAWEARWGDLIEETRHV